MKKSEEMKLALSNEVYALAEMYGLHHHESVTAIASAAARILCQDAPDRQTAETLQKAFNCAIKQVIRDSAENGSASWSHQRMH
jgi:hypothetical protein